MAKNPPDWQSYSRLQDKLSKQTCANDRSFGVESALTWLLAPDRTSDLTAPPPIERLVANASRRERWRVHKLRHFVYQDDCSLTSSCLDAVLTDEGLQNARNSMTPADWQLLLYTASGCEYVELEKTFGVIASALRVRVLRLRKKLKKF